MRAMIAADQSAPMPPALERRRAALMEFASAVRELASGTCRAVVACGPAAAGHASAEIDTAIVLTGDELPFLRALARRGRGFAGAGLGAPLVLTEAGIAASTDTYPLELLDLQQCQWPLHGDDPFAGLTFSGEHLRLQCERELTSLTIRLRRRLLAAAGRETTLTLADLGDEVVRVARGLLLRQGQVAPRDAPAVLQAAGTMLGRPLSAALAAWGGASGWDAFAAFYAETETLRNAVDAG